MTVEDCPSVGVRDSSSPGSVDRGPRLDDSGKVEELRVSVDAGISSGIEPTRLAGDAR